PARSPRASLYLSDDTVMRTETSPAQIHKMEAGRPPIFMVSIGRVYRRDTTDATHFPIFHQFEGLAIDKGITMADLKGTLLYVMRQLYGPEREVRFRTHYFPFTEPSMEPDVSCMVCGRVGCAVCKHPDADRLQLCKVDVGEGKPYQIVCGAWNFGAGAKVAVALPGATLSNGLTLERRNLRGELSEGMILAEDEVDLGTDHSGIMVF